MLRVLGSSHAVVRRTSALGSAPGSRGPAARCVLAVLQAPHAPFSGGGWKNFPDLIEKWNPNVFKQVRETREGYHPPIIEVSAFGFNPPPPPPPPPPPLPPYPRATSI